MCSINGFNFNDANLVKNMIKVQHHRGPDDSGYFTDSKLSLGHTRLSIIDLSKNGHQPMWSRDETACIVFNGEIYNYKHLRAKLEEYRHRFISSTDTEVIINAYLQYGVNCLEKFNCMFAFCLYDREKNILFLARDRVGEKPLYYYFEDGKFIFSSEIKAILEHPIERSINLSALNNYLTFRYNRLHQSMFFNIYKLPPAHYMIFDLSKKTIKISKYWDVKNSMDSVQEKPLQIYIEELNLALEESINSRLISDVPVGVYLSGGVDSSAIVSYISKLGHDIKTFSVNTGDSRFEDPKYAQLVADFFHTDHKEIFIDIDASKILPEVVYHQDEPVADPSSLAMYLMSKQVRPDAIVDDRLLREEFYL